MTTDYLDISESVTDEQYRKVLNSLLDQFEDWRIDKGWCTDLYHFVAQLSRTFRWNSRVTGYFTDSYSGRMELEIPADRTGEERARDLREIRGRILRFIYEQSSYLNLDRANEFLSTAGLAPYTPEGNKQRYHVEIYGYIASELNSDEIRVKAQRWMTRQGGTNPTINVTADTIRNRRVPDSETTALLSNTGNY
jgi:hypothetical protein